MSKWILVIILSFGDGQYTIAQLGPFNDMEACMKASGKLNMRYRTSIGNHVNQRTTFIECFPLSNEAYEINEDLAPAPFAP